MSGFFLLIIVLLIALAATDLIVGVSNDAVNFLNSAIGSKVAPMRVILIVAALGVLVGATFSSGMMEVARKGIFHPEMFAFSDIMILFLAVMLTDILLLDFFNTYGLPTSTTVSIVFELLGSAVAIALLKTLHNPESGHQVIDYINSGKALAIIAGILFSIAIAFLVGAIIQYLVRLVFSFNYEKYIKYFGALWGGFSFSAITYFILIKGAKGSSIVTPETLEWIKTHTTLILGISFVGWTLILQLLFSIFRINILKGIVLTGTFALAMAFAGNDLVNFIGVPLAGLASYQEFTQMGGTDPASFMMTALAGPVKTPTLYLLIAGTIMVITLWLSKKARTVTATSVDLSRQQEGTERFESSFLARAIVRQTVGLSRIIKYATPGSLRRFVEKQFDRTQYNHLKEKEGVAFDLVRASVNLVVASILIAIGTSYKLPLSTTYVTFMVAMGTSLADRAWGRESAVYRVTGVIVVVTGWFVTALVAFTIAFIIAIILFYGKLIAILALITLAGYMIVRNKFTHSKREEEKEENEKLQKTAAYKREGALTECKNESINTLLNVSKNYYLTVKYFSEEKRKKLKEVLKDIEKLNKHAKTLKNNVYFTLQKLEEDSVETGYFYVQELDYLRETAHCMEFLAQPLFKHIDNNHPIFPEELMTEVLELAEETSNLFNHVVQTIKSDKYEDLPEIIEKQQQILDRIKKLRKKQIKMIRNETIQMKTRTSTLFLDFLNESKNLLLFLVNTLKAHRDFVQHHNNLAGVIKDKQPPTS